MVLIIFPLLGLMAGLFLDGAPGAIWGAAAGFVLALAVSGVMTYGLVKASRRD
ncbi:hypothetical protein [Sphingomonas abietis]|uniref:CTP synthetase n=1 Tax=Sphingomonas abietis TaxID=3012344 RepID=A0ABY7NVW9_9SPHN|nr:hypothetical protein [Sphingomonas abietis]WBO24727.1 hypothetical protein PBT88_04830 [Sphingomonas abietis]